MVSMKRCMCCLIAFLLVALLISPVFAASKAIEIKLANFYAPEHPMNVALREVFVPEVESRTDGQVKVYIYDSSQLGAEREFTESLSLGAIEMGITGGLLSATYPKIALLELPYLFKDYQHARDALNGPVGQEIAAEFLQKNIRVLAWAANGFRVMSNNKRPINSVDDLKGLRMRVPENKIYIDTLKALGANVVTMPMSEVFTALKQGVMDGQENPFSTLYASGWYEVQKHAAVTYHLFSHASISISETFWKKLPTDIQQVIEEAAVKTADYEWGLLEKDEAEVIEILKGKGVMITYPELGPFREATQSVRDDFSKKYPETEKLIETILQ